MISQGDDVYIVEDVLDHDGSVMSPDTTGRGTVVGFAGLVVAVVQWGIAGDYRYADVPFEKLKKYQRSHK